MPPAFLEGFAGTVQGSFFKAPLWVDLTKKPGHTSQAKVVDAAPEWLNLLSGRFLFFSPNLVWLVIALGVYFIFPYDFEAAKVFAWDWVLERAAINICVVHAFFGFWHIALYFLNWSSRPFAEGRKYRIAKVAHNVWYTTLGAVQWTAWEALFMYCYATKRLPFFSDEEAQTSLWGCAKVVLGFFLVPLWRECHFYFAHRLIHLKPLYKYVHALHHRNTDIEPFSGLCMHPIEHLYYYSCVGPSLYCFASPFAFLWNGMHLLISPAASHSGWEDHWQSDQFHYLHHRYFECNYGTGTFPFDRVFGTFQDSLKQGPTSTYKGSRTDGAEPVDESDKAAADTDTKANLVGLPPVDELVFNALTIGTIVLAAATGLHQALEGGLPTDGPFAFLRTTVEVLSPLTSRPRLLSALVAFGPPALGTLLLAMKMIARTGSFSLRKLRYTLFFPFHKEPLLGAFGFNMLLGLLLTAVPVYHTVEMFLAEPGQAAYFQLRNASEGLIEL